MHKPQLANQGPSSERLPARDAARRRPAHEHQPLEFGVCGSVLVEADADVRLRLYGRLDANSASELDANLLVPRLDDSPAGFTVDLAGLTEIDPVAIGLLLHRQRQALEQGTHLLIRMSARQAAQFA